MSDVPQIKGFVEEIQQLESFASGFQKQSLIVRTEGQYPQFINIEFVKDKIELLSQVKKDDEVAVCYNINGRSWTSPKGDVKYFNTITGWKIDKLAETQPTQATAYQAPPEPKANVFEEDEDDLPF